eukprot:GDKI01015474.1.p2 GENE.GDKI01015474.1~~GDKI01015474.1.p2  ORF type:complete len:196 (+),score=77.68 GDKI01015474.1:30-590(+)
MAPKRKAAAAVVKDDAPQDAVEKGDGVKETSPKKVKPEGLVKGEQAPDFELENDECVKVKLSEVTKDSGVVIFFYPKANTPGCTKQACGFRDKLAAIKEKGYVVYGMSADNPKPQGNWRTKHNFGFNLLCDPGREALKQFGVLKNAGKSIRRSHVVIGKGGKVEDVQYDISPADSFTQAAEFVGAK